MLSALLKKQLQEIFRSYFYNAKQGKARSRASTVGYFAFFAVLMVGVLGGLFTYLAHSLCAPFAAAGMEWLYFTIMAMVAIVLGAFGSVFNTYSSLYLAKDNDLLLSMPIPVRTILLSRLLSVYLMGLLYSGVVLLPAMIVYWVTVSAAPAALAGGLLLFALVTIFVLTLSCALGWVVARVSLKLKHRSITVVLTSLLFLSAYYFVYFKAQSFLSELVTNAAYYGAQIRGKAYPLYLIGRAGAGDGPAMAVVTAVVLVLFVLLFWLLSRSFLRIATASGSTVRRVYREKTAVQRGAGTALLARELRHFGGNPSYMLNCGLGILLMPLGGTALLWKRDFLDVLQPMVGGQGIALILCALVCLLASMNLMAAPSVSLEGRTLWLVQSLPVRPWQVLRAKLQLQLVLTAVPALIAAVCAAVAAARPVGETLLLLAVPLGYVLLLALFGLFAGLKLPNLTWTNEITPIKQGGSVMLALFGGFVYAGLLPLAYFLGASALGLSACLGIYLGLTLALAAVLYVWLRRRGAAVFAAL